MIFNNGSEALLRKLNNMQVFTWEIPEADVRFEASFLDGVIGLLDAKNQYDTVGLCVIKDLLEYIKPNMNYICSDIEDNTDSLGWTAECNDGYFYGESPYIIDHYSEVDDNGKRNVIFTINFTTPPCSECLICSHSTNYYCNDNSQKNHAS